MVEVGVHEAKTTLSDLLRRVAAVATLPRLHGDLFDRLLVAQAQLEKIPLVTADAHITRYDVMVVPAV